MAISTFKQESNIAGESATVAGEVDLCTVRYAYSHYIHSRARAHTHVRTYMHAPLRPHAPFACPRTRAFVCVFVRACMRE